MSRPRAARRGQGERDGTGHLRSVPEGVLHELDVVGG
jgi:hypothetical protein